MQGIVWVEFLIAIVLAMLGGVVRRFSDIEKDPSQEFTLKEYIFTAVISGFIGIVAFALLSHFSVSALLSIAVVSIAGFTGSPLLKLLSSLLMKKVENTGNAHINNAVKKIDSGGGGSEGGEADND